MRDPDRLRRGGPLLYCSRSLKKCSADFQPVFSTTGWPTSSGGGGGDDPRECLTVMVRSVSQMWVTNRGSVIDSPMSEGHGPPVHRHSQRIKWRTAARAEARGSEHRTGKCAQAKEAAASDGKNAPITAPARTADRGSAGAIGNAGVSLFRLWRRGCSVKSPKRVSIPTRRRRIR